MTHRPKVAILKSKIGNGGGLEKYALRTAQAFADKGCQVTILTSSKLPAPPPNLEILSLCPSSKLSVRHIQEFDQSCQRWLAQNSQDITFGMDRNTIQTHYRAGNGIHAAYLDRRKREEGLLKAASFWINPLHRKILSLERATFQGPHLRHLFTNSSMVKDEVIHYYDITPEKITVIHNGVEWQEMEEDFQLWPQTRDASPFTFLFVGHEYRRKGLGNLLNALSRIKDPWQLLVLGRDREPKHFEHLAAKLNIQDRVHFFGPQDNVRRFYQIADTLVIPSLYDPFANVTVEALAMGVPVISSKDNGGSEILSEATGSVVEDVRDAVAFSEVLREALGQPKTVASARKIRESVRHLDFSHQLDIMVRQTLERNTS